MIGDIGRGSYVAAGVAEFFRDRAIPLATIAAPNAFELEWLTGVTSRDAASPARRWPRCAPRGPRVVVVKSLALDDTPGDAIDMLAADETGALPFRTPKLAVAVNGAGDVFTALFFHHWLETRETRAALSRAGSAVFALVQATAALGVRELALVAAQEELRRPSRLIEAEAI